MRQTTNLISQVAGQTFSLRVPQGRPTSATFKVFRNYVDDDATPEFSGTATVDTVNTTVNVSSGASQTDPQKISLASTAGIVVGRQYLLSENSLQEWVTPVEVRATYIRVRFPLDNDYSTAATFVSTLITAAVDSTFINDLSKLSDLADLAPDFRVRWSIVLASGTTTAYSFFDVLRADQRHHVDISDINARAPGLHDSMPIEYRAEDGRPLVDASWRAVRAHFTAIGIDINALRDDEVLDELVILRALQILADGGWSPAQADWDTWRKAQTDNYQRFFEMHFAASLKHQVQYQLASPTKGQMPPVEHPFWRK